jgi:HTH-type transcriptional regulator / antitoxin HigA
VERMMQNLDIERTIVAWSSIAKTVFVPHTEQEYDRLVELLDSLIDRVGENESHPLASMMDVIGVLIENYESEYVAELEEVV